MYHFLISCVIYICYSCNPFSVIERVFPNYNQFSLHLDVNENATPSLIVMSVCLRPVNPQSSTFSLLYYNMENCTYFTSSKYPLQSQTFHACFKYVYQQTSYALLLFMSPYFQVHSVNIAWEATSCDFRVFHIFFSCTKAGLSHEKLKRFIVTYVWVDKQLSKTILGKNMCLLLDPQFRDGRITNHKAVGTFGEIIVS